MSADNQKTSGITLKERKNMCVFGVEEVMSFDDEGAHLRCSDGELFIEGKNVRIQSLDVENGSVTLEGQINAVYYTDDESKKRGGVFGRLMR